MLNFYLIFFSSLHYIDTAAHMIKVTDLEYFIFIAFTLKFGVKSLLSEGGDTGRGGGGGGGGGRGVYMSPCSLALVLTA